MKENFKNKLSIIFISTLEKGVLALGAYFTYHAISFKNTLHSCDWQNLAFNFFRLL